MRAPRRTFVCPTELRALSERCEAFRAEGAEIVGVSVDSVFTHRAWLTAPPERGGLGELRFPLASDLSHDRARSLDRIARLDVADPKLAQGDSSTTGAARAAAIAGGGSESASATAPAPVIR